MITIDEHTFDEKLLTGGWVIDAGCKDWRFSIALRDLGCKVIALDIDKFNDVPDGIEYVNSGLGSKLVEVKEAHFFGDGSANFVKGLHGIPGDLPDRPCVTREVTLIGFSHILPHICSRQWEQNGFHLGLDLLKLDIEMSEYDVLMSIDEHILFNQICVEFHPHVNIELHNRMYEKVLKHLSQWYEVSFHSTYPAYPSMDTLFIRKDLL